VNDARLVQCQHCKEDDGGKDGEEKDSTFFHGIVTPAPIQKIWGIGTSLHPSGRQTQEITMTGKDELPDWGAAL